MVGFGLRSRHFSNGVGRLDYRALGVARVYGVLAAGWYSNVYEYIWDIDSMLV